MRKIQIQKRSGNVNVPARLHVLNQRERHAVLATESNGQPYTSLVAFAITSDLKGIVFATPRKTTKYRNILKNGNVSLLIDTRSNSPQGYTKSEAVTILGRARSIRQGEKWDNLAELYIKKHPQLKNFILAGTSAIVLVTIEKVFHAAQFQTVTKWILKKE